MTDFVSEKLATYELAQEKAEDAARVIQGRSPGSYVKWINKETLRVFSATHQSIATIHLETLQ